MKKPEDGYLGVEAKGEEELDTLSKLKRKIRRLEK